jgi:hypothetical protein
VVVTESPIWTLNGRDNVILDVLSGLLALTDRQTRRVIVGSHDELLRILSGKLVDYTSLRAALVPAQNREEYVFLFEVDQLDEFAAPSYSAVAGAQILPLLNRATTCSIMHGDLIYPDVDRGIILLDRHVVKQRSIEIANTNEIFGIYINNLSRPMFERIHAGLGGYRPYLGYAAVTGNSPMKDWVSTVLGPCYLKAGRRFICAHEDDTSNEENDNLPMWPLGDNNYEYSSLQAMYFDLFLSYKIERTVRPGFEGDVRFGLSAISDTPASLAEFDVIIEDNKFVYLSDGPHSGSLRLAGLDALSASALGEMIAAKLQDGYVYNLRFRGDSDTSLFNMIIEVRAHERTSNVRLLAAFEYKPSERLLRLVTLI